MQPLTIKHSCPKEMKSFNTKALKGSKMYDQSILHRSNISYIKLLHSILHCKDLEDTISIPVYCTFHSGFAVSVVMLS